MHICFRIYRQSIQHRKCIRPFVDRTFHHSNSDTFLYNLYHKFHRRMVDHSDDLGIELIKIMFKFITFLIADDLMAINKKKKERRKIEPFHPTAQKHWPVSGLHFPCVQLHFCVQSPKKPSSHCFSHL